MGRKEMRRERSSKKRFFDFIFHIRCQLLLILFQEVIISLGQSFVNYSFIVTRPHRENFLKMPHES